MLSGVGKENEQAGVGGTKLEALRQERSSAPGPGPAHRGVGGHVVPRGGHSRLPAKMATVRKAFPRRLVGLASLRAVSAPGG